MRQFKWCFTNKSRQKRTWHEISLNEDDDALVFKSIHTICGDPTVRKVFVEFDDGSGVEYVSV